MIWLITAFFLIFPQFSEAKDITNTLHRLLLIKKKMESQFGLEQLECYPFIDKIGLTKDQKPLIENCLRSAEILLQVLRVTKRRDLRVVGISDRFLKTGGFDTVLIRSGASQDDMIRFLGSPLTQKEQQYFLEQINKTKTFIRKKIKVGKLYCTQRISNKNCLQGYINLAEVLKNTLLKNKSWREIVITDSETTMEDPDALPLRFDSDADTLRDRLVFRDSEKEWARREDLYAKIEEQYGSWFRKKLKLSKLICSLDLTDKQCMEGATSFYIAAPKLQNYFWGEVIIDKHNTLIQDDFVTLIRFDLAPDEIIKNLSKKPTKKQTHQNNLLAEKLELRTKNNPSGLRVVCDLKGLRSDLCVKGFQAFFAFMKQTRRKYLADSKWETLMWIDGEQLSRVNFALNSGARKSYIYADTNADLNEVSKYLMKFGTISGEKDFP